jgi:hypothetical protein
MKVLETVLSFFLTLAQVIFPRKRKPSPSDRPCPPPQPLPPVPPLPLEGGNGSDPGLHRRDSLPPEEQPTFPRIPTPLPLFPRPPATLSRLAGNLRLHTDRLRGSGMRLQVADGVR